MPYLPKTFSLKTIGQQLVEAVEDGLRQMKQLQDKKETALKNYIGPALEQMLIEFRTKMDELKAAKRTEIEGIKKRAREDIRRPMENATPEDLVPNDLMRLDDKFFAPDQEIFDSLVEKYKDNFTMINALCKYANDHQNVISFYRPPTIDEMDELVDSAVEICIDAINSENSGGSFTWAIVYEADFGSINRILNDHLGPQHSIGSVNYNKGDAYNYDYK